MSATVIALATYRRQMIVESELLGDVAVEPDELITFPAGLLGFPACREFVLLPSERQGMYWLQSVEHSPLAFVLVDPFLAVEGFAVDVTASDLAELDAKVESDLAVLAIVTLGSAELGGCTLNLQGPVAFNLRTRRAKQIAIPNSDYGVRWPVDLAGL
jgi:flagellar assembly factor FliW